MFHSRSITNYQPHFLCHIVGINIAPLLTLGGVSGILVGLSAQSVMANMVAGINLARPTQHAEILECFSRCLDQRSWQTAHPSGRSSHGQYKCWHQAGVTPLKDLPYPGPVLATPEQGLLISGRWHHTHDMRVLNAHFSRLCMMCMSGSLRMVIEESLLNRQRPCVQQRSCC